MRVIGEMGKQMDMEFLIMLTVMFTKESLKMTRLMVRAITTTKMDLNSRDIGRMILNVVMVEKNGKMVRFMRGPLIRD